MSDARQPADLEAALELAGALWFFWMHHTSAPGEARLWLTRALEVAPAGRSAARGKALLALGAIEWRQGDYGLARLHLDHSEEIFREIGDFQGLAHTFHLAAHVLFEGQDFSHARELFEVSREAYARAGDLLGGLPLVGDLGMVAYHQGDYETARGLFEACLRTCREQGVTDHAADSLNRLGDLARLAGDFVHARSKRDGSWRRASVCNVRSATSRGSSSAWSRSLALRSSGPHPSALSSSWPPAKRTWTTLEHHWRPRTVPTSSATWLAARPA